MINSTLRLKPVAIGSNEHIFYFVNEEQWKATEKSPSKRELLKALKIDFINKTISNPVLIRNVFPFNSIEKMNKLEEKFINMRIDLNFSYEIIYDMIVKPLCIKFHQNDMAMN